MGGCATEVHRACLIAAFQLVERVLEPVHQVPEEELVVDDGVRGTVPGARRLDRHGVEYVDLVPFRGVLLVGEVRLRRVFSCQLGIVLGELDGVWILAVHGGKFVANGIENHDEIMPSINLVWHPRNELGHVKEELGAHSLEAGSRKTVLQVPGVNLDRLANLLGREALTDMVDEVRQHTIREGSHRLMDCKAVPDQCPLVQ